uniref:Gustatory receptor n=1 Tax=Ditylenchus dipsaci TaxID=166011 RepID=A0A915DYG3_9BILA
MFIENMCRTSFMAPSRQWAPPVRVIAVITLFASTLDLMADFLLCARLAEFLNNFQTEIARNCAYGYFFFTGISILVYIFEMVDVCLTLKNDEEDVFFARLAKSLVLVCEEVPLPGLLWVLFSSEPRLSLANPMHISSWIKLITLSWGIIKFAKLRFFWPLLPLNPKHTYREIHRVAERLDLVVCDLLWSVHCFGQRLNKDKERPIFSNIYICLRRLSFKKTISNMSAFPLSSNVAHIRRYGNSRSLRQMSEPAGAVVPKNTSSSRTRSSSPGSIKVQHSNADIPNVTAGGHTLARHLQHSLKFGQNMGSFSPFIHQQQPLGSISVDTIFSSILPVNINTDKQDFGLTAKKYDSGFGSALNVSSLAGFGLATSSFIKTGTDSVSSVQCVIDALQNIATQQNRN